MRKRRLTQASQYFGQDGECGGRSEPGSRTPDAVLCEHQLGWTLSAAGTLTSSLPPFPAVLSHHPDSYLTLKNIHITRYKLAQLPTIRQTQLFLQDSPHNQRGCPSSPYLSHPALSSQHSQALMAQIIRSLLHLHLSQLPLQ